MHYAQHSSHTCYCVYDISWWPLKISLLIQSIANFDLLKRLFGSATLFILCSCELKNLSQWVPSVLVFRGSFILLSLLSSTWLTRLFFSLLLYPFWLLFSGFLTFLMFLPSLTPATCDVEAKHSHPTKTYCRDYATIGFSSLHEYSLARHRPSWLLLLSCFRP